MDTICTIHYAVFSGGGYYLYYALRGIFRGWIQFVQCTLQCFQGVDTICTMHYAVFSGGGYYLYYALRSIFRRWIRYHGQIITRILGLQVKFGDTETGFALEYGLQECDPAGLSRSGQWCWGGAGAPGVGECGERNSGSLSGDDMGVGGCIGSRRGRLWSRCRRDGG